MLSAQRILVLLLCLLIGGREVYAAGVCISEQLAKDLVDCQKHHEGLWTLPYEIMEEEVSDEGEDEGDDEDLSVHEMSVLYPASPKLDLTRQFTTSVCAVFHAEQRFLYLRKLRL